MGQVACSSMCASNRQTFHAVRLFDLLCSVERGLVAVIPDRTAIVNIRVGMVHATYVKTPTRSHPLRQKP